MKTQRKRLILCVALVLLCAFILPIFGGCAKEAPQTTTAEEAGNEAETGSVPTTTKNPPVVTQSNPNAESLQSTPNKGGSKQLTSGTNSVKSAYSTMLENLQAEAAGTTAAALLQTASERRDYVEAYMRAMMSVEWTVDEREGYYIKSDGKTITRGDYDSDEAFEKAAFEQTNYTYKVGSYTFPVEVGRVYRGIPYSNGASGLETFFCFLDKEDGNGVYHMNFDVLHLYGGQKVARVGADAINALVYSWNTVSTTSYAQTADHIVPVNGFYPVGGYEIPELSEEEKKALATKPPFDNGVLVGAGVADKLNLTYDGSLANDTDDIVAYNGEQKMYAAYAQLQKADGLVRNDGSVGAMMAVSVNTVKNADGTINGEESYVIVHEQTHENSTKEKMEDGVYIIGNLDKKVTFKELFDENYIPVTVLELTDGSEPASEATCRYQYEHATTYNAKGYLYSGYITATRRVLWANVTLYDSQGNVVYDTISFAEREDIKLGSERRYGFDSSKIDDAHDVSVGLGDEPVLGSSLPKGNTYRYVVKLQLITGEEVVARDFEFDT